MSLFDHFKRKNPTSSSTNHNNHENNNSSSSTRNGASKDGISDLTTDAPTRGKLYDPRKAGTRHLLEEFTNDTAPTHWKLYGERNTGTRY